MPTILSQDPNGRWTIKNIRHTSLQGLKIPATFTYNGQSVTFEIEDTPKTVLTDWYTTPGEAGKLDIENMVNGVFPRVDDVDRAYTPVTYGGYAYKVMNEQFEVTAYSGSDTGDTGVTYYLNVTNFVGFEYNTDLTRNIEVSTNVPSWTPSVVTGSSWLSVQKVSGGIKITATANTGAARDGRIKIVADGGEVSTKYISVTQAKKPAEQTPYIELSIPNYGDAYEIDSNGGTIELSVHSNTRWKLSKSNNVGWITITSDGYSNVVTGGTGNASLFVTIGEYAGTSQNRGMTISGITLDDGSIYDTVKITQLKGSDTCTQEGTPCDCDGNDTCSSECTPYSPCTCDDECSSECVPYSPCSCDDECSSECVPYSPCDTAPCSCDDEIAPCPEDCYVEENGNIYLEKEGIADESHELTIPVGATEQDITYKVWTNTDCQVSGITAATQNGTAYAEFYDNEGNTLGVFSPFGPFCGEKVDFSVHIPKNLANVEQEYKIVFRALNSNNSAKAIFQQERKKVIGREDYKIENFWIRDASSPEQYVPADEAYYTPFVQVMCTESYNNGDSFETDVTDYWNNGAIDENKLTITTNDTTNCIILDDVGHGGGYQASPEYPFKIYLRANSGTTGVGSERHINLTLTYTNGGMETVSKTIEIIQAYQMVIPEENDVQFYYQGEYLDEIEADTRVNESFTVTVAKGTAGSTKLYVISPDGANLSSYVSNVTLAGVTLTEDDLDHHDGIIMQESSVIFTFNRDVPYEFSIGILVEEPGKEDKQLVVEFPSLN